MAEKRLVAVCDILGFKNLVKNRDITQLVAGDLFLFRRLVGFALNREEVPALSPELSNIRERARVSFAWFSDTLSYTQRMMKTCPVGTSWRVLVGFYFSL